MSKWNKCFAFCIPFLLVFPFVFAGGKPLYAQTDKKSQVIAGNDKQDISGFIKIAFAWGTQLTPPQRYVRGLINLKNSMHKWTKIQTSIEGHVYLSSPEIQKFPFVYITTENSFEISEIEKENIKNLIDKGGFIVLESATPDVENNQAQASLKQMVRDVFGSQAKFSPLSNSHPIYHCFFDFDDGPPNGAETSGSNDPIYYLEGIWYKERLIGLYSGKGYIVKWSDMTNNEPQLKMGVNMLVFALLQNK